MNDREYVKLNTSINTASNSRDLLYDEAGNIRATIELRLPDNLFDDNAHTRKIDHVSMQTSKMRLSMEETPIAEVPIDPTLSKDGVIVSSCEMDVYPFALTGEGKLFPNALNLSNSAFPWYKKHPIYFSARIHYYFRDPNDPSRVLNGYWPIVPSTTGYSNTADFLVPSDSPCYEALKAAGALHLADHMMNLVFPKNQEQPMVAGNKLLIRNVHTLEQMLQDGIENAISYACTTNREISDPTEEDPTQPLLVYTFVMGDGIPDDVPINPNAKFFTTIGDYTTTEFLGYELSGWAFYSYADIGAFGDHPNFVSNLSYSVKPIVRCGNESFSISYDTAAFDTTIPILWNPAYVDTGDKPLALTLDDLRREAWDGQQPLKRMYKYEVNNVIDPETGLSTNYTYGLNTRLNSAPINIVGNRAMAETFSFLPWIKVDTQEYAQFQPRPGEFRYTYEYTARIEYSTVEGLQHQVVESNSSSRYRGQVYTGYQAEGEEDHAFVVEYCVDSSITDPAEIKNRDNWYGIQILYGSVSYTDNNQPIPAGIVLIDEDSEFTPDPGSIPGPEPGDGVYETNDRKLAYSNATWRERKTQTVELEPTTISIGTPFTRFLLQADIDFAGGEWGNTPTFEQQWNAASPGFLPSASYMNDHYLPLADWEETGHGTANWCYSFPEPREANPSTGYPGNYSDSESLGTKELVIGGETKVCNIYRRRFVINVDTDFRGYDLLCLPIYTSFDVQTTQTTNWWVDCAQMFKSHNFLTCDNYIPNITLDEGRYFYLLDGSANNVTIGPQEPVKANSGIAQPYHVKVDANKTTVRTRRIVEQQILEDEAYKITGVNWTLAEAALTELAFATFTRYIRYHVRAKYNVLTRTVDLSTAVLTNVKNGNNAPVMGYNPELITSKYRATLKNEDRSIGEPETIVDPTVTEEYDSSDSLTVGTTTETKTETAVINEHSTTEQDPEGTHEEEGYMMIMNKFISGILPNIVRAFVSGGAQAVINLIFQHGSFATEKIRRLRMYANKEESYTESTNYFIPRHRAPAYITYDGIADLIEGEHYINLYYPVGLHIPEVSFSLLGQSISFPTEANYYPEYSMAMPVTTRVTSAQHVDNITYTTTTTITENEATEGDTLYKGNLHLTFTWDKLPMVIMSPIQSIVLTLEGVQVNQEYQPVNMKQPDGSSLTSTVPIIENYYSLAQTLRDLHDELVVVKEQFDTTATYTLSKTSGQERTLRISAKYVTKSGMLEQIYIPPNGVFSLQLTFGISYYMV